MSNSSIKFEEIIIKNDIIGNIISYMTIDSMRNMVMSSKIIYECRDVISIIKRLILKKGYIINKYIKRYCRIIKKIKSIESNNVEFPIFGYDILKAFYYYRYYPQIHIKGYFDCVKSKLHFNDDFFKDNNLSDNDPKRNDLFNLIRLLQYDEIAYVGW
jgi:hypothetical protein